MPHAVKRHSVCGPRQTTGAVKSCLMGGSTTVDVIVNGSVVRALLDTGATVSIISRAAVSKLKLSVLPVKDFLHVECANGQALPYDGYVTMSVSLPNNSASTCIALVIPNENATGAAQLILGTNVLPSLLPASGEMPEPLQVVAECLKARDNQLSAAGGSLAFVQLAAKGPLCLKANTSVAVPVRLDRPMPYHQTHAIVEPCVDSVLPAGVEVAPGLCVYDGRNIDSSEVVLNNCSSSTVRLEVGALVAKLSPVIVTGDAPQGDELSDSITSPDFGATAFSSHNQELLRNLVTEYANVMARNELDLGHYKGVEHTIELEDPKPFKQRYRRIPSHMFEEVRDHLRQLEACGVIRPSKSQYSSPVVCCRKKDGKLRLCVDYRLLNSRTRKYNYCFPRVDEILDSLRGAKYFSRLDLKSGYHQIAIREDHKPYTAFTVGPLGFWEHNRLAFGLCNSPGTFHRVMEDCFSDLNLRIMYIYTDDIIVFSETAEEHLDRLRSVWLQDCGLKLSLKKCAFAQSQVSFLGHLISDEGVRPDPEKIAKVKDWPSPRNPKERRSFLGFAGYYRKFVERYSEIARPLKSLLPPTRKRNDKSCPKKIKWEWEDRHEKNFQCLKKFLFTAPLLAYADFTKPFELHIDASTVGLGAVLYQVISGNKKVIAYASRALTKSEQRYPAHKLEFLCLK
ncbi:Pol polyprotein [Elysia marginata]|uniref:Pol polyprotein n=1 Tax=Elysia marginata TaxID=1093978 RepID=A0AAV4FWX3_9GAST|nr:Pol polyprotein [Elysia marginata]